MYLVFVLGLFYVTKIVIGIFFGGGEPWNQGVGKVVFSPMDMEHFYKEKTQKPWFQRCHLLDQLKVPGSRFFKPAKRFSSFCESGSNPWMEDDFFL